MGLYLTKIMHHFGKIMYDGATFFKAYFYQRFIQFTMHYLIYLIQCAQLCIMVTNL